MKNCILVILVSALFHPAVFAKPAGVERCPMVPWLYPKTGPAKSFHILMLALPRDQVAASYLYESTQSQDKEFLRYLSTYLIGTETNSQLRGYYKLLRWGSELDEKKGAQSRALPKRDVCALYSKALTLSNGKKPRKKH